MQKKKLALIIAFREFRDEEYFVPKEIFKKEGITVITVSNCKGKAIGKMGGEADVDLLIKDLKAEDFNAIIFIGGPGAFDYFENEDCHKIIKKAVLLKKILGAICIAPAILAKAGVLKGKNATIWSSVMDKSGIKILEGMGAKFIKKDVVVDQKIITASGPEAAENFSKKIIYGLNS